MPWRQRLHDLVESEYFADGLSFVIVLNTMLLGVQHELDSPIGSLWTQNDAMLQYGTSSSAPGARAPTLPSSSFIPWSLSSRSHFIQRFGVGRWMLGAGVWGQASPRVRGSQIFGYDQRSIGQGSRI